MFGSEEALQDGMTCHHHKTGYISLRAADSITYPKDVEDA
jgi:hypothetical protein